MRTPTRSIDRLAVRISAGFVIPWRNGHKYLDSSGAIKTAGTSGGVGNRHTLSPNA